MKKILILLLFGCLATLQSCFEDKGNYEYTKLGVIKVSGLEEKYSAVSMKDHLNIPVEVESTLEESEYEYVWGVHIATSGGTYQEVDTISLEKDLSYNVVLDPGSYRLVLSVRNLKLDIVKYAYANLSVTTAFSEGWYVLKDSENKTEMDLYLNSGEKMVDLIQKAIGRPLNGNALSLGFYPKFSWNIYENPVIKNANKKAFLPISTEEAILLEADKMKLIHDYDQMFYSGQTSAKPRFALYSESAMMVGLVNESGIFSISTMIAAGAGKFQNPLLLDNEPIMPSKYISKGSSNFLFDELKSRFLAMNYAGSLLILGDKKEDKTLGVMSPNDMNSDLMCMCPLNSLYPYSGTGYALMRTRDADKKLYVLNLNLVNIGKAYNPIETVVDLDKSMDIYNAKVYGFNYEVSFIYYTYNNVLNYYDCVTNMEYKNCTTFPAGENIIFIKHLIYNAPAADIDNKFNHILVGTAIGDKYKVYVYNTLGGVPYGEPVKVLEGDGRAVDVHFISSKMNSGGQYTV